MAIQQTTRPNRLPPEIFDLPVEKMREGDYTLFAHLETVYLGVLTRRTLITTNTARVVEAANGKPIIFMPARHDHHRVQTGDGYAAYVAGAMIGAEIGVTSDAQASWWGGRGVGTVPHALIASYGGNTVLAATKFAEWAGDDMKIVASGGFTVEKIEAFEAKGVPVDAYGVGSSLIRGQNDFTGDVVMTDGRPSAKVGRRYRPNPRLELVA